MVPAAPQKSLSGVITSEDGLVEKPGLDLLVELGWTHANLMKEEPGPANPTGRLSFRELVLACAPSRRAPQAQSVAAGRGVAAGRACADRRPLRDAAGGGEPRRLRLLRDGIPVQVRQPDGSLKDERVAVIDWTNPAANDFFLASQVWIESSLYKRRPDALGFVNGIPLLLIEWKDLTKPVQEAYEANLRDYRDTIPRLFDFNGFTILSNGLEALMGAEPRALRELRALEAAGGGWTGERGAGDDAARHLRTLALPRPDRELPAVRGCAWRAAQGRRQVSSGARRQPRHRGRGADRREPGAASASSGTRKAAARASRW